MCFLRLHVNTMVFGINLKLVAESHEFFTSQKSLFESINPEHFMCRSITVTTNERTVIDRYMQLMRNIIRDRQPGLSVKNLPNHLREIAGMDVENAEAYFETLKNIGSPVIDAHALRTKTRYRTTGNYVVL